MFYEKVILISVIVALAANAILNGYYFFNVTSFWRWIKLIYAMNSILTIGLLSMSFISGIRREHLLFSVLLLSFTLVGGTIVSLAKIRIGRVAEKQLDQIIQKANGHSK